MTSQSQFAFETPLRDRVDADRLREMRAVAVETEVMPVGTRTRRKDSRTGDINVTRAAHATNTRSFTPAQARREASDAAMRDKEHVWGRIMAWAQGRRFTVDELAADWGCPTTHVAPRVTELLKLGKLEPTGERRRTRMQGWAAVLAVRG